MSTVYHAKYFAHELPRQSQPGGVDRLSMALFDARVDLNPHQIEAAMLTLRSPLSKGVILAGEVRLGKTIEAGLVLCQLWAEPKRKLLIICPASLQNQWALELQEEFNLPSIVLDAKSYKGVVRGGNPDGERAMVLWRNLDEWFKKQDFNTKDQEYDLIYVNGDNNLESFRHSDQTWKVRMIEEEFGRLMFEVEER